MADRPVLPVIDRYAVGQVAVKRVVLLDERCGGGGGELAGGLIGGALREVGLIRRRVLRTRRGWKG